MIQPQQIIIRAQELENLIRNELYGVQAQIRHGADFTDELVKATAKNIVRMASKEPICLTKKT